MDIQTQSIPSERPHLNLMLIQSLTPEFNSTQWQSIIKHDPKIFKKVQQQIVRNLLFDTNLFNKYFPLFYQNHVNLYHWYLLAKQKKSAISPYICKDLLEYNLGQYKDKSRNIQKMKEQQILMKKKKSEDLINCKKRDEKQIQNMRRTTMNEYTKQIFKFLANQSKSPTLQVDKKHKFLVSLQKSDKDNHSKRLLSTPRKKIPLKDSHSLTRGQKQNNPPNCYSARIKQISNGQSRRNFDFHDLYLRTFHACDGLRYIFYNYEKHMKGLSEKDKYNTFIRLGTKREKSSNGFEISSKYPQWDYKVGEDELNQSNSDELRKSIYEYHQCGRINEQKHEFYPNKTTYKCFGSKNHIFLRKYRNNNTGKFIRKAKMQ